LVSIGPWRATVTEYDWEYVERVQATGGQSGGGGCASGGAMSLLFHRTLGPILVASMTQYQIIEVSNQQVFTDAPHMTLTPRIEVKGDATYTSLSDLEATVATTDSAGQITFEVHGRLLTAAHQPLPTGEVHYHLTYRLAESSVSITATASGATVPSSPLYFVLPVVSPASESVARTAANAISIAKAKGGLTVHTDSPRGFDEVPQDRTFNLVPGFECVPLAVPMELGQPITITLEAAVRA
jgi:hypothetical protein